MPARFFHSRRRGSYQLPCPESLCQVPTAASGAGGSGLIIGSGAEGRLRRVGTGSRPPRHSRGRRPRRRPPPWPAHRRARSRPARVALPSPMLGVGLHLPPRRLLGRLLLRPPRRPLRLAGAVDRLLVLLGRRSCPARSARPRRPRCRRRRPSRRTTAPARSSGRPRRPPTAPGRPGGYPRAPAARPARGPRRPRAPARAGPPSRRAARDRSSPIRSSTSAADRNRRFAAGRSSWRPASKLATRSSSALARSCSPRQLLVGPDVDLRLVLRHRERLDRFGDPLAHRRPVGTRALEGGQDRIPAAPRLFEDVQRHGAE